MATKKKSSKKKAGKKKTTAMPKVDTSCLSDYTTTEGGQSKTLFSCNGARRFTGIEAVPGAKGKNSWVVVKGVVNEPGSKDHGRYSDGIFNVSGTVEYGRKRDKGKPNLLIEIAPLLRGCGYSDEEIADMASSGETDAQQIADMINAKSELFARTFSKFYKDGDRYQTVIGEGVSPEKYEKLVKDELNTWPLEDKVLEHEPSEDDDEEEEEGEEEEEESEDEDEDSDGDEEEEEDDDTDF